MARKWFVFSDWRLQTKVLLLLIAGLVVLFLSMAYLGYQAVQYSTDRMLEERLSVAEFVANNTDAVVHRRLRQLQAVVAASWQEPEYNESAKPTILPSRVEEVLGGIIVVVDEAGHVVSAGTNGVPLLGASLEAQPDVLDALKDGQPRILTTQGAPFGPGPMVLLVAPLGQVNRTGGLVINAVDPAELVWGGASQSLKLGQTGYAELVDQHGMVLARTEPGRPPDKLEKSDHADRFKMLIREDRPVVRTCHRCHETDTGTARRRDVAAFAPLSGLPWGVVLRQSEDEALQPTRRLQSSLIIFDLLAWPVALIVVWAFTRRVVRPIGQLTEATQRIAAGELDTPMESSRQDEIGRLAKSFEDMRVQLRRSRQQLEQRAEDLEAKTKELSALFEVSSALASTLQMETVLKGTTEALRALFPAADAGAVFLYRPEEHRLVAEASFGFDGAGPEVLTFAPGEGCAGEAFASQQPVLLEGHEPAGPGERTVDEGGDASRLLAEGPGLAVPLAAEDQVLGSLALYSRRGGVFSPSEMQLLRNLANQATLAILNARLFREASLAGAWRELNRLKTEFVARASHQLRTPLTVIKSLAETLLRRDVRLSSRERREFLEGIDRAADRLTRLVADLLAVTRFESGKLELRAGPLPLPAVVERVVAEFRRNTSRDFTVSIAPKLPFVFADPDRVEDVLSNLISNAVKYSPGGGTIVVDLRPADGRSLPPEVGLSGRQGESPAFVVVSVTDGGVGIAAADQFRLFQPFSRIDNPVTRSTAGAGLGLYICKTYLEAMHGAIWVVSEPGRQTTFSFCLPAFRGANASASVKSKPRDKSLPFALPVRVAGRHVLVVDDEPDVLKAV
ncbi:MAG: ATP-binding protein, partial [Bacteroidetes bacterium]|nr:ATP-binding protein [Bacteroidota bacterium]